MTYIPSEIMQYSITKHKAAKAVENGSNSLALSGGNEVAAFLHGEGGSGVDVSSMNPVIALVLSVCRLCNLEKMFISNGLIDVLSPQLCDTVVWCLAQLVGPYLMLDENCYQEVGMLANTLKLMCLDSHSIAFHSIPLGLTIIIMFLISHKKVLYCCS